MRLGYTVLYVPDVERTVSFYEDAFGLDRRFVHESGDYAEMETGQTALAFASNDLASSNLEAAYRPADTYARFSERCNRAAVPSPCHPERSAAESKDLLWGDVQAAEMGCAGLRFPDCVRDDKGGGRCGGGRLALRGGVRTLPA